MNIASQIEQYIAVQVIRAFLFFFFKIHLAGDLIFYFKKENATALG